MPPEEYKFPDEIENKVETTDVNISVDSEGDIGIDVEDDTPERDRFAKPLGREVAEPSDEELESYGAKVKARIKELTHARHDERREKERLAREKAELERVAQQLMEERRRYVQYINDGTQTHVETLKAKAESELEMARRKYKEAQESYDSEAMLQAQEDLTDAKMRLEAARNFRPAPLQVPQEVVQRQQQVPKPQLDEKTLRWQAKNQWFGSPGYEELTAFALGLHQKLVTTGYDPRSDEYFERVDSRMRSVFPEVFQGNDKTTKAESAKRPATVVASASRSTGAKKNVKLSTSAAAIADRLGVSHADYAREFLKLEANNG
jgi:ribosomal protein L44E